MSEVERYAEKNANEVWRQTRGNLRRGKRSGDSSDSDKFVGWLHTMMVGGRGDVLVVQAAYIHVGVDYFSSHRLSIVRPPTATLLPALDRLPCLLAVLCVCPLHCQLITLLLPAHSCSLSHCQSTARLSNRPCSWKLPRSSVHPIHRWVSRPSPFASCLHNG